MRQPFFALAFVMAAAAARAQPAPELLLLNGRVYTQDAARPWAEAAAQGS